MIQDRTQVCRQEDFDALAKLVKSQQEKMNADLVLQQDGGK